MRVSRAAEPSLRFFLPQPDAGKAKWPRLGPSPFPAALTSIGYETFSSCAKLATMKYAGAKADWAKVTLGEDWHMSCTLLTAVSCTDGDVTL
jgi:hypothetical protein